MKAIDRNGLAVARGMRVRVLRIADPVLQGLPADEQADLRSMVGEVFEVYEVDEHGAAWVQKTWTDGDGTRTHSVGLDAHEMEVV